MKFRKKPVVVEAVLWLGDFSVLPDWAQRAVVAEFPAHNLCTISTLEGTMLATQGDWIIKGIKGEVYPCKPDIFAATYEPAE